MPTPQDKAKESSNSLPNVDWITLWIIATNWNWMDADSKCLGSVNAEVDPDLVLDPGPAPVHALEADLGLAPDLAAALAPDPGTLVLNPVQDLNLAPSPALNLGAVPDPQIATETLPKPTETENALNLEAVRAPDPNPALNPVQDLNPGMIEILDILTEDKIINYKNDTTAFLILPFYFAMIP